MSSDVETNRFLKKINEKSEQLRTEGLTRDDQELLNNNRREREVSRLELIWGEELDPQDATTSTLWRRFRARQRYREVQDADEHLFLAFILTIPPTECIKKSFGSTIACLDRLENYGPYRLNLSQAAKGFFESTASDHGFASSPRYLSFMDALFPLNTEICDGVHLDILEDGRQTNQSLSDPQSLAYSLNSHSTIHTVLPRPLKRMATSTDNEYYPRQTLGATDNLGPERSSAIKLRRLLDNPPNSNEDGQQNSTLSRATWTNTPISETQKEPTTISEVSANKAYSTTTQKELVYENALLQRLGQVFDRHLSSAIERVKVNSDGVTSLKAAVTMVFPSWALLDCLMSFDVNASKVEYLAMALFNVRVETVENVRYITMKGGVRLQPNPEIILKGVLDDAIIDVFSPEIHGAIAACCMRGKELEVGNDVTDCVSMLFTSNPSEGATINLALGLEEGTQIRKKLYTGI